MMLNTTDEVSQAAHSAAIPSYPSPVSAHSSPSLTYTQLAPLDIEDATTTSPLSPASTNPTSPPPDTNADTPGSTHTVASPNGAHKRRVCVRVACAGLCCLLLMGVALVLFGWIVEVIAQQQDNGSGD